MKTLGQLILMMLLLVGDATSIAQTLNNFGNTNTTPIAGSGHDYITGLNEIVNPANGALSIRIAQPRPVERGKNWSHSALDYDTNGFFQVTPTYAVFAGLTELQVLTYSKRAIPSPGSITYDSGFLENPGTAPNGQPVQQSACNAYTNFVYTDPNGGVHPMGMSVGIPANVGGNIVPSCSPFGIPNFYSGGDEQYKATIDPKTMDISIVDSHGNRPLIEDTNGNYANSSGRSLPSQTGSGGPTDTFTVTETIPGVNGNYIYSYSPQTVTYTIPINVVGGTCLTRSITPTGDTNGAITFSALRSLTLPDGGVYQFQYDSTYGFINKIIYPNGAYVQYQWGINANSEGHSYIPGFQNGPNPQNCSVTYGWPAIQKRFVSYDGVSVAEEQDFTYTTTYPSTSTYLWSSKTTKVVTKDLVRGQNFTTNYSYTALPKPTGGPAGGDAGNIPLEQTITYSDTNGTLLKTVTKQWLTTNLLAAECETVPNAGTSGKFYKYRPFDWSSFPTFYDAPSGSNGGDPMFAGVAWTDQIADLAEYDYGTVSTNCVQPSSTPLKETKTTVFWNQTHPNTPLFTFGPSIMDRPQTVQIIGPEGLVAETDYGYDETTVQSTSPAAINLDPEYAANQPVSRGNMTSMTQRCIQGCSANSKTTYAYDETGQLISMTDPCGNSACSDISGTGHTTTFSYTDRYTSDDGSPIGNTNIYLTKLTKPSANGVQMTQQFQYGFNDGKLRVSTDENGNDTRYCYFTGGCSGNNFDPWFRNTEVDFPDGGKTNTSYNDAGAFPSTTTSILINAGGTREVSDTILDGMGHVIHTDLISDPSGADHVDTTYDGLGRIYTVTNPYRSTSDPTYGKTTYFYDALGRKTMQSLQDSSTQQWNYSGDTVTYTDEASHPWKRTTDALGRLKQVLEPDGNNNPTIETDYQYDALGNLKRVDQWGGGSSHDNTVDRVRTFTYDSLSRLTASSNPETGAISYIYDANGNLINKTDARGSGINYGYDALNRLTIKYADNGSFTYEYLYDATGHGASIGRLTHRSNDVNAASDPTYDAMGRVIQQTYCIPSDCSYNTRVSAGYDLAGNLTSLTYPDGRTINQQWNGAGEVSQIADGSGYQYLTNQSTYWPNGAPSAIFHGNNEADGYDRNNRLQINEIGHVHIGSSGVNSNESLSVKEYCYGPATAALSSTIPGCPPLSNGKNNGNIWLIMDTLNNSNSQGFTYDNLNRIAQFASNDRSMQQGFGIDAWGNMTMGGTSSFSVNYGGNNRISSSGFGYDAAGNLTTFNNGVMTNSYGYDAEGKLINVNNGGATYTYDADGIRARKDSAGSFTEYVQFNGQTIAEKSSDGTWSDYIFANGQRIARADNYDIRIHMSGTNCSGCGSTNTFAGTVALTGAVNGTVVRSGDLLTWRQSQDGVASGGISLAFNNNTVGTTGVLRDTDGQLTDADTTLNAWHLRTADLTPYAGMTFSSLNLYNFQGGAPGNWDIYVGDISLVHTDGTFVPIYSRSIETLAQFPAGAAESNVVVETQKAVGTMDGISTATFFHSNQLGSTEMITASTGWPVASYTYYPYGLGPTAAGNHYLFTGKERDTESGLDYFGARYYGSSMGRFMSPDDDSGEHADQPQSWNLYSYVQNNPVTNTDPDGHDCIDTSNFATDGTVTVTRGDSCASSLGPNGTYVNGTIDTSSITATVSGSGTSFGYNFTSYDGQSGGAGVIAQAPPYGPLEGPANLAGANMIGNGGMAAINEFVKQSLIGAAFEGAGQAIGMGVDALRAARAAKAAEALAVAERVTQHAYLKHAGEFGNISRNEFQSLVQETMANPSEVRSLSNGRTAYWSDSQQMVVIENGTAPSQSTAFRPTAGRAYFDNMR